MHKINNGSNEYFGSNEYLWSVHLWEMMAHIYKVNNTQTLPQITICISYYIIGV